MTKNSKHVPQRTCCVCRAKSDKHSLIRIVRDPQGSPVIDRNMKLEGKGMYICPDTDCIEKAKKSGRIRSFTVSDNNFWNELEDYSKTFGVNTDLKLRSVLGLSRKAGTLLIGTDSIDREKRKVLVLTASDCSENVQKFASSHENIMLKFDSDELSNIIGVKGRVQIVGLPMASGFAKKLLSLNFEKGEMPFE